MCKIESYTICITVLLLLLLLLFDLFELGLRHSVGLSTSIVTPHFQLNFGQNSNKTMNGKLVETE